MEAQLHRPSQGPHHLYEDDPHHARLHSVEGEVDQQGAHHHHGEKKSVLKKVKDKAKKIKDTIKKHGHEHEHEGGHRREGIYQEGYVEEEEDDDEDEEMVKDPEVHGAPMYESSVVRSTNLPEETHIDTKKPTNTLDDRYEQLASDKGLTRPPAMVVRQPENKNAPSIVPHTFDKERPNVEHPKIKIGPPIGLEEDPHSPNNSPAGVPPSNYQSKVADPTGHGGKEADVAPLISQFDNLNVHSVSDKKHEPEHNLSPYSVSPDQFAPHETPTETRSNPQSNPASDPEPNTIAAKISYATSAVASTAVSAKNAMASKLGYGGVGGPHEGQGPQMKEYLADKFRPGDEDKALSEAIRDAFYRKNEAEEGTTRVKESDEVAARLGTAAETKREGEDALAAGAESSAAGEGVVDRLKDAFGNWIGKSAGIKTAEESVGGSYVSDVGSATDKAGQGGDIAERRE